MVQEARVAGERLFEIMELDTEPRGAPIPLTRSDVGDVVLDGVHFRYGARAAALTDVSITCARGRVTALVGESGSGKSTIAALLQRLYPLDAGRIRVGAHDIAHVELSGLRRLVGVVPQTIDLFAGTILDNLVLGDGTPDVARLVALCDEIGLRDSIERLPLGWMTPVGERGAALSGGERQRLAIVRALYREPAVLVLDEATSALDAANEHRVLATIRRVAEGGTTVIVIAHRLTTVRSADQVVVLERGRVVEQGTHESLVVADGAYRRLWAYQSPGTSPAPAAEA
jgi:ATP-binding cassette subfamily B protein